MVRSDYCGDGRAQTEFGSEYEPLAVYGSTGVAGSLTRNMAVLHNESVGPRDPEDRGEGLRAKISPSAPGRAATHSQENR